MHITTKSGRKVHLPNPEEDAAIDAGIAADRDNPEWTAEDFAKAKPASEVLSPEMYTALIAKRPRGRPKADETKVFTAIRLDADLLDAFKSTGKGWQTRMNEALRHYLIDSGARGEGISTMFRIERNRFVSVCPATRNDPKEEILHGTDRTHR